MPIVSGVAGVEEIRDGTAWDDAASVGRWRKVRRTGRIWLSIGVILFCGFLVYVTRLYDHRDQLIANGVRTTGVVLQDPPQALRCGRVPVPIRFPVAGRAQVHPFFVDGCGGGGLEQGDRVAVWYDPKSPGDFVVNGAANEKPVETLLACIALVASAFFVGAFAIRARRLHALRRILRAHPWRTGRARVAAFGSPWTKGRGVVEFLDPGPRVVLVTQAQSTLALSLDSPLLTAGTEHGSYALQDPNSGSLVLAHPPRSSGAKRRAQSGLDRLTAPTRFRVS